MVSFLLALALAAAAPQEPGTKKIPNDSVEIQARGCLKGRVFTAAPRTEDEGVALGPDVTGRNFRLAGKKDLMEVVKQHDGHLVAIVGIVRKADLTAPELGTRVGKTRVIVGQPGRDPMRGNLPTPAPVPVMDMTSVQFIDTVCTIK
jgi:hypothetical protein